MFLFLISIFFLCSSCVVSGLFFMCCLWSVLHECIARVFFMFLLLFFIFIPQPAPGSKDFNTPAPCYNIHQFGEWPFKPLWEVNCPVILLRLGNQTQIENVPAPITFCPGLSPLRLPTPCYGCLTPSSKENGGGGGGKNVKCLINTNSMALYRLVCNWAICILQHFKGRAIHTDLSVTGLMSQV